MRLKLRWVLHNGRIRSFASFHFWCSPENLPLEKFQSLLGQFGFGMVDLPAIGSPTG